MKKRKKQRSCNNDSHFFSWFTCFQCRKYLLQDIHIKFYKQPDDYAKLFCARVGITGHIVKWAPVEAWPVADAMTYFDRENGAKMKAGFRALLLLGPTGAGKTPLGEALEKSGVHGCRAVHFDFGAHLRRAVIHPAEYPLLSADDVAVIDAKLRRNALLEDNEFPVAAKILTSFIHTMNPSRDEYIILNGLPRHLGQAEAVDLLVKVEEVIYLDCSVSVVHHRITTNAGGDRALRIDDSDPEIRRKLKIFRDRTEPLLDFYHRRNVLIRKVLIREGMSGDEVCFYSRGLNSKET
jgi:adenylate kinase